jgi:MoxR-vWA-beta-propeller ternary system protein
VDLAFRFLPDLFRIARAASESDPLLKVLQRWTVEWPLSTVGIPIDRAADLTTQFVMGDETLRKLYADRIIARQDRSRVKDVAVRTAVRDWIGYYPEYAGGLRDVLQVTPDSHSTGRESAADCE